MEKFLEGLNPVQRAAVIQANGPSLIIAGAGSGKTRVLTFRIAYLLKLGVAPHSILALTFTNKAAKEMKERIASIVDPKLANRLWMGTFHSIFARILRVEAEAIGYTSNFTIYDNADTLSVIRGIVKEMQLDDKNYKDKTVYSRISTAKNHLMTPQSYAANAQLTLEDREARCPRIPEIYQRYAAKCKSANAMDFDDLLLYTNILFRDHPQILEKYQKLFRYILVDEYQDTNVAQYLIVKRLAEKSKNLSVVGDDAQSIYSFRGARIENILNFRNDYPGYAEFKLEQNYRSTQTIVNAANSLISKNKKQLKKKCFSAGDLGERIELLKAFTDQEEGFLIASSIIETVYSKQAEYSKFAILYRTNAQSRIFEDALRKRNIPYRIYGGISFYQRAEIKDALAYMRLAANPSDDEALKRIINYPARGIGDTTLDRIQQAATENSCSMWEVLTRIPLSNYGIKDGIARKLNDFVLLIEPFIKSAHVDEAYEFASTIILRTGMLADLKSNNTPEGIARVENIEELLNGIKEYYENKQDESEGLSGQLPITDFLENVALITDADNDDPENTPKVALMTVHASKGLEFDYVYIVGMEEGLFPGTNTSQSEQGLEEERRLFYVALTRAAVKATISYAQCRYRWGNVVNCTTSRFLRDIDASYLYQGDVQISTERVLNRKSVESQPDSPRRLKPLQAKSTSNLTSPQNSSSSSDFPIASNLKQGMEVEHERFGKGRVLSIEDDKAQVEFYNAGIKVLLLKFARLKILK